MMLTNFEKVQAHEFKPNNWTEGIHLFTGWGMNFTSYKSNTETRSAGVGTDIKADVGWYFNNQWAFELSASVKFNKSVDSLVWDTLLTLGGRYRIERPIWGNYGYYSKFFIGSSSTVVFPNGSRPENSEASRYHFESTVLGGGIGRIMRSESDLIWFVETSFSVQYMKYQNDVVLDGEVPIVISRSTLADDSKLYSLYLTAGILLF